MGVAGARPRALAGLACAFCDFLSRGSTVLAFFMTGSGSVLFGNESCAAFSAFRSIHKLLVLKNLRRAREAAECWRATPPLVHRKERQLISWV